MLPLILLCALPAVWAQSNCTEFPDDREVFTMDFPFDHWGPGGSPLCPITNDGRGAINPLYRMYTDTNRFIGEYFTVDTIPSVYVPTRHTIFVVHGWNANPDNSPWMMDLKNNLLNEGNYNVVIVDWRGASMQANYNLAASSTRTAGAWTAEVMENLVDNGGEWNWMYCVGQSLGAHLCGFAGHWVRDHMGGLMDRITGMDPAGPMFEANDANSRVNRFAAEYVDIIHTNTQVLGNNNTLGHHDYYPGDGQSMPGCGDDVGGFCSHMRSVDFYIESIVTNCFVAREVCDGHDENGLPIGCSPALINSYMGYHSNKLLPGDDQTIYRLYVNGETPFCTN